jgi:predicted AAA+ superfamily ATPase
MHIFNYFRALYNELGGEMNLFYWKDPLQTEVDFVLHAGNAVRTLIQVCADPQSPKVREREIRGLLKASRELRCEDLLLLTDEEEGAAREQWQGHQAEVRRQPVWKWLLAQG